MREREHLEKTAPKRIDRELTELLQAHTHTHTHTHTHRIHVLKSEWIVT